MAADGAGGIRRLLVANRGEMESPLRAPVDGRVARVVVASGTRVEAGDLLLAVEPGDGAA